MELTQGYVPHSVIKRLTYIISFNLTKWALVLIFCYMRKLKLRKFVSGAMAP